MLSQIRAFEQNVIESKYCRAVSSNMSHLEPHPGNFQCLCTVTFFQKVYFLIKIGLNLSNSEIAECLT